MKIKPKILIVDDRPENLFALRTVLKGMDVQIVEATSGNEALKQTLRHDFALALLDIQMPDMDGYELAKILRDEEKTEHLPFIFISAVYTDTKDAFKGYEVGAFSFIAKPFQPEILVNKVQFFIDKHQQQITLIELNKELKKKNDELAFQNDEKEKRAEELIITNKQLEESIVRQKLAQKKTGELGEQLKANVKELSDRNIELEQFSHIISHDLKEPLRKITLSGDMLLKNLDKQPLNQESLRSIKVMREAALRMKDQIEDLLIYTTSIDKSIGFETVDLNDVVYKVFNDLESTIIVSKADIKTDNLPVVSGNASQLSLLFQNFITNSIKYCKSGTYPVIKIKCTLVKGIEINMPAENYHKIMVIDNGIGFDQKYATKIFEIFQRLHDKTEYAGTGLGLAICSRIVENHKGLITAESIEGLGSTFSVFLPA